jgi:hypothetical protein
MRLDDPSLNKPATESISDSVLRKFNNAREYELVSVVSTRLL